MVIGAVDVVLLVVVTMVELVVIELPVAKLVVDDVRGILDPGGTGLAFHSDIAHDPLCISSVTIWTHPQSDPDPPQV